MSELSTPHRRDRRPLLFLTSALIIVLDRVTKLAVQKHIAEGMAKTIIPGVFRITHVVNNGAAFSLFDNDPTKPVHPALTIVSIVESLVVAFLLVRFGRRWSATSLGLALVLGGALGNLWDRLHSGAVTDFLEVHIYHYHWPDFNVADSAIVIGAILLFLGALFTPRQQEPA